MLAGLATLLLARAVAAVDDPSWDVHTPTNATCLGGCACPARLAACVPTAPSKDMKVFASSLASLAEHAVDIESIHVVSRKSPEVDRVIAAVNARATGPAGTSDVVLLRDVAFVHGTANSAGRCDATYAYAFSRESHGLYYDTNKKLLGDDDGKPLPDAAGRDISGVVHHMAMRADVLAALDARVWRCTAPLYDALLRPAVGVVAEAHRNAFSEYQFYFHYARRAFPASVAVRQLYWANGPGPKTIVECEAADGWPAGAQRGARDDADIRAIDFKAGYDYVAYHSAKRRPCVYGPRTTAATAARFGGGCTRFKRRDDARYKARDRSGAPRRGGVIKTQRLKAAAAQAVLAAKVKPADTADRSRYGSVLARGHTVRG
ncbi:hypothetical protein JL720_9544 [Aureococcus anophagefferens]|nr:hypothetical protein JL720_9544 [Aureococcus anophagefferens]